MKKLSIAVLILFSMLTTTPVIATVGLMVNPKIQFFNNSGQPCTGCKIYFYEPGTSTPKDTYADSLKTIVNTNPVVLSSRGEPLSPIWQEGIYKVIFKTASDQTIWSVDNVYTISDSAIASAISEWVLVGLAPTYVSGTSFSVAGDYTSTFLVNRRISITDATDTNYGKITTSVYASGVTTVTITLDSGTIDVGVASVSVALITPVNKSISFDDIASGSFVNTGTMESSGTNTLSGTQNITGNIRSSGSNSFSGSTSLTGTLTITGNIASSGTNSFTGPLSISSSVTSSITSSWFGEYNILGNIKSSGSNSFFGVNEFTGTTLVSGLTSSQTITSNLVGNVTGNINSTTGPNTLAGPVTIGDVSSSGTITFNYGVFYHLYALTPVIADIVGNAATASLADDVITKYPAVVSSDVTASRTFVTAYQNTTGRPMFVSISASSNTAGTHALGHIGATSNPTTTVVITTFPAASYNISFSFWVPVNYYYNATVSNGSPDLVHWIESY